MKILADRSFERDVKRLPGQAQQRLKGLLQEIAVATTLFSTKLVFEICPDVEQITI